MKCNMFNTICGISFVMLTTLLAGLYLDLFIVALLLVLGIGFVLFILFGLSYLNEQYQKKEVLSKSEPLGNNYFKINGYPCDYEWLFNGNFRPLSKDGKYRCVKFVDGLFGIESFVNSQWKILEKYTEPLWNRECLPNEYGKWYRFDNKDKQKITNFTNYLNGSTNPVPVS